MDRISLLFRSIGRFIGSAFLFSIGLECSLGLECSPNLFSHVQRVVCFLLGLKLSDLDVIGSFVRRRRQSRQFANKSSFDAARSYQRIFVYFNYQIVYVMSLTKSSIPVILLTRDGRWMLEEDAAKYLTVGGDVKAFNRFHRNQLWIHSERGPSNLSPHCKFNFVYVCYDRNVMASSHLPITKVEFTKVSHYLSDESNTSSPDEYMATLFERYTGVVATESNIKLAFLVGALIRSQSLEEILNRRQEEKKKAAESLCTKGIGGKRLREATNITYRESIGIVLDKMGVLRSDLCNK